MKKKLLILSVLFIIPVMLFAQTGGGGRGGGRGRRSSDLTISSNVSGARVVITGNNVNEVGSATFTKNLAHGDYTIEVSAENYITETVTINLTKDDNITVNLRPATGTVTVILTGSSINSKDVGARNQIQVYDNGTLLTGDFTWQMRPGQHTIQIISGGVMAQTTINVQAGQTYRLEPNFSIVVR